MTMKEISRFTGMGWRSVQRRLKASGTTIRKRKRKVASEYPSIAGKKAHVRNAEEKYGRKVQENEVVHHLDMDKGNASPDNLVITTRKNHNQIHLQMQELVGALYKSGVITWNESAMRYEFK